MEVFMCIAALFLIAFFVIDVWYFLRLLYMFIYTSLLPRMSPLDPFVVFGMCISTDIDMMLTHKNNGRYLREVDFAMVHFWLRTGLWSELRRRNSSLLVQGTTVRYRKPIALFSAYRIQTRVLYWDDTALYFEHRFVTLHDDFLRTIVVCKQRIVGGAKLGSIFHDMFNNNIPQAEPALHFQKWIELNEAIKYPTQQCTERTESEKES